jgi:ribonuclease BN (tRNA processing enzyme)
VDALLETLPHADPELRVHILRSHTEAAEVGRIARNAGVEALALTHFVPDGLPDFGRERFEAAVRETYDGPLHIGRDGLRIPL